MRLPRSLTDARSENLDGASDDVLGWRTPRLSSQMGKCSVRLENLGQLQTDYLASRRESGFGGTSSRQETGPRCRRHFPEAISAAPNYVNTSPGSANPARDDRRYVPAVRETELYVRRPRPSRPRPPLAAVANSQWRDRARQLAPGPEPDMTTREVKRYKQFQATLAEIVEVDEPTNLSHTRGVVQK